MSEAADKVEGWGGTSAPTRLLGAMSPAERRAGRYLRGPDGDGGAGHAPAPAEPPVVVAGAADPADPPAEPAPAAAPEPAPAGGLVRPEGLPDEFWDDADGVKLGDVVAKLREYEELRADLPEGPDGYELKVSDAVKVPEGFDVTLNPDDPLVKAVMPALHEAGVGKVAAQKIIDAYAAAQIADQEAWVDNYAAGKKALGEKANERLAAVDSWVAANVKSEQAAALKEVLYGRDFSPKAVEAIEAIIALRQLKPAQPGAQAGANFDNLFGAERLAAIREREAAKAA